MEGKNPTNRYVDYINSYILPFIDYYKLQYSYSTDMVYAKGILNRLHEAMIKVYGSERLDIDDTEDGFVIIPAVVRGSESKNICIALIQLDLSSSGEHWSTDFLCKYGVISQDGNSVMQNNNKISMSEFKEIKSMYIPYDYCYTAAIPCDIHVDRARLPEVLKSVLQDFRNHKAELQFEHEELQGESASALVDAIGHQMDEKSFERWMSALLPGITTEDLKNLFAYAKELEEGETISASDYFKQTFVEFGLLTRQHGQEDAQQILEVFKTFTLNPWEIRDAADSIRSGVPIENIGKMAVDTGFDRTGKQQQESDDTLAAFEKIAPDNPQQEDASAELFALGTDLMDSFDFLIKMGTILPNAGLDSLRKILEFAESLGEEGSYSKAEYLTTTLTEYDLAARKYGQDIAQKLLDLSSTFIVNPKKIQSAAILLRDGVKPEDIPRLVVSGKPLQNKSLALGNKPSVLDKIRGAERPPKEPKADKPTRKKSGPER